MTADNITLAFTGILPFILLLSTLFAFPLSFLLLSRYRKAVLKGMNRHSHKPKERESAHDVQSPAAGAPADRSIRITPVTDAGMEGILYRRAIASPRQAGLVYGAGGLAFTAVLAFAFLQAGKMEILPMRFLVLLCVHAWPLVLTLALVSAARWRTKLILIGAYCCIYTAIATAALLRSPDSSILQVGLLWLITNLPPTLVILLFLNRRVRAIGPLAMIFIVVALGGAIILVSLLQIDQALLQTVAGIGFSMGLGATGVICALVLTGFALSALPCWYLISWIRHHYRAKRVNDRSLVVDTVWFLSGITYAISLVFGGVAWILAGPAAFAAYFGIVRCGFRLTAGAGTPSPPARLLLLRVFSLGRRSEALFDAITRHWRYIGYVQLISGPDLATTTMDPDEFFDIMRGNLGNHFVADTESLDTRVNGMDIRPDFDGRYRVNEFFCHDDTWQMTLDRLVDSSDVVLMDVRGFSRQNAGCVYEVRKLVSSASVDRVVMTIDASTDLPFLEKTVHDACAAMHHAFPNASGTAELRVVRLDTGDAGFFTLLRLLCSSAEATQAMSPVVAAQHA